MMDKALTLLIGGEPLFQFKEFARLSKFSLKTLLYNDQIDMLKPIRGGTMRIEKQHYYLYYGSCSFFNWDR